MEKQIKLNFDPIAHKYSDDSGLVYTSVTTVIGKYVPPFNEKYWSMYTALRDSGFKVRPDESEKTIVVDGQFRSLDSLYKNPINSFEVSRLIDKWKVMTTVACDRGNEIHNFLEDGINASKDDDGSSNDLIKPNLVSALGAVGLVAIRTKHDLDKTNIEERFPIIYKRLLAYINMGCTLFAEKRIYSTVYLIAGMIDVLIVKGKLFAILDWKSNKDVMMFRSGYFKKARINGIWAKTDNFIEKKSYLQSPLNNVENCKGMIYTLQLSLYAFIMELWGYKLIGNGLEIFHIRPGLEPQLIKVEYRRDDVLRMLEHHKTKCVSNKLTTNFLGIR